MAHKFFKKTAERSININKFKKYAHDVWSMSEENGSVMATRKKDEEKREVGEPPDELEDLLGGEMGGLVVLLLGGETLPGKVLAKSAGMVRVATARGEVEVPEYYVRSAQADNQPAVNPASAELSKLLEQNGGQVSIAIDETGTNILQIVIGQGGAISTTLWSVVPKYYDQRQFNNLDEMLQEMQLSGPFNVVPTPQPRQ